MRNVRIAAASAALLAVVTLTGCDVANDDPDAVADTTNAFGIESNDDVPDSIVPAGPVSADDGCTALDEAALEQAIGFDVVMNDNATGNCVATPASGDASAPTVDFRIEPRTNAFDYFSAQPDASPVANLGERAVWATLNETTGYVVTVSNGRSIVVGVGRADGVNAQSRRQAEAIARLLLENQ